ncbi:MAG: TadE/TadG family type IV pilus assembly protein [Candidatus Sulfotelmatobacter sp.]
MKRPEWTTCGGLARGTRGSEIAESAVILPLLFMVVMAIFWFGQAFRIYGTITHAAREGARAAVVPACATCSATTSAQNAVNAVNSVLAAAKLNSALVQQPVPPPVLYACTQSSPCGSAVPCTYVGSSNVCVQSNVQLSSCTATPASEATCGTAVSFGYKYPYHFVIPLTTLDLGNITLPAQAQMRMETQ